jgi:hypothetical protein
VVHQCLKPHDYSLSFLGQEYDAIGPSGLGCHIGFVASLSAVAGGPRAFNGVESAAFRGSCCDFIVEEDQYST